MTINLAFDNKQVKAALAAMLSEIRQQETAHHLPDVSDLQVLILAFARHDHETG